MLTPIRFFCGIAALWGEPDSHGHQFQPGTFARSIAAFNIGSISVPIYAEHALLPEWPDPIGRALLLGESERGLEVTFLLDPMSEEKWSQLQALMPAWYLSVGLAWHDFMRTEVPRRPGKSPRYDVSDGLLMEISLSPNPAAGLGATAHELDRLMIGFGNQIVIR